MVKFILVMSVASALLFVGLSGLSKAAAGLQHTGSSRDRQMAQINAER